MNPSLSVLLALICALGAGCTAAPPAASADARITALADAYLAAYFDRYPEEGTYYGVPGRRHDRLFDNTLAALEAWEAQVDGWLVEARAIDPAQAASATLRATHAIVREALEGATASRVCHLELWPVSQMSGWQVGDGYLATIQPVGTPDARGEALARWGALPAYLDREIANLREGLRRGYSSPKPIVRIVIDQVTTLATGADSPLRSPAARDDSAEFQQAFQALVNDRLVPAVLRYRDFLQTEYLPAARDTIAVSAHPDGGACYQASVRKFSTLPIASPDVHRLGLARMEQILTEIRTIAERSFGAVELQPLLETLRTDRRYLFADRDDLIEYSKAALVRGSAAAPRWFGLLPTAGVAIEPYPAYREQNAPGEYNPPAEDGSRPALFYISAYRAENQSRAAAESTAFHETIPGHHLQVAIALERRDIHPIGRYLFTSGYVEGWALYAERLADEMGLYSSDLDRLGMWSSQAFRAARLVVDSGLHTLGWSRQEAIDYMLAHTTEEPAAAAAEIDRYIILPGQATAYMLGMIEIEGARLEAEERLGPQFDIKAFHDRVLEDGGVPLTFLAGKIRGWAGGGS